MAAYSVRSSEFSEFLPHATARDVDGDGKADFAISLEAKYNLWASDFDL